MFDTFIVTRDALSDPGKLERHPYVKRVIWLPRDFALYEYHDDFLDLETRKDGELEAAMQADPQLRKARAKAIAEKRGLRAPFYAVDRPGVRRLGKFLLGASSCTYWINIMRPVRWIAFDSGSLETRWDREPALRASLELASSIAPESLEGLLDDWFRCGRDYGGVESVREVSGSGEGAAFDLKFSSLTGHWIATLFVLLSDARKKVGVAGMTLSQPS